MMWKGMLRRTMMNCQEMVDLLSDYLAGELSESEITAIRMHLKGCPTCETFFDSLKTTVRLTKKLKCEDIPQAVIERLQSFLRERTRP